MRLSARFRVPKTQIAGLVCLAVLGLGARPGVAQTISEIVDMTGPLETATSVATDAAGNVYVAGVTAQGISGDSVLKITPAGVVTEIINYSDGLDQPEGLATDASGNVYVSGYHSSNVFKIDTAGMITEIMNDSHGLDGPQAVATDASGNVFVAGFIGNNAFKITPTGVITEIIDSSGDRGGNILDKAWGIATDASGNVYVSGLESDNVFRIETPGACSTGGTACVITEIIDLTGDGAGNALDGPFGLATDPSGNVFVAAEATDNVFRITPAGVVTEIIDSTGGGVAPLDKPLNVATDAFGNVFVTGQDSDNAFKITPAGVITQIIDSAGDAVNMLGLAWGVASDLSGNVYVSGFNTKNLFKIEFLDFGDAAEAGSILTQLPLGASHTILPVANPQLGVTAPDSEPDGVPTAGADGDDSAGSDDEDGLELVQPDPKVAVVGETITLVAGDSPDVEINVQRNGATGVYLEAFLDYDGDGGIDETVGPAAVTSDGTRTISLANLPTSVPGTPGTMRLRVHQESGGVGLNGAAPSGEVEDYEIRFVGDYDYGDGPADADSDFGNDYPVLLADSGARHEITATHRLGATIDFEFDGQSNADASGDDGDGTDDEDGVAFNEGIVAGASSTSSIQVTTFGAGFLSAWIDFNQDGVWTDEASATGEEVFSNLAVGSPSSSVTAQYPIAVPAGAIPGVTYVRVRFCSVSGECDEPTGLASDGEVEDHQVTLLDINNLAISTGAAIDSDGTNITISYANGNTVTVPIAALTGGALTLMGTGDADSVTLTPALMRTSGLTVFVNLGAGFDTLTLPPGTIVGTGTGTLTHIFTNATDGRIKVSNGATIFYTGLDPIIDNLDATTRIFDFSAFDDTIVLTPDGDGSLGNGYSFIDSENSESVLFKNPTDRLTINAGDGEDTVVLGEMDGPVGAGFVLEVNGGDGAGTDTAADAFQITPSTAYEIEVNGENYLGTCPVDALTLNLSGGAVVATQDGPGASGTITFSSGHLDVDFTRIEAIGNADVSVTLSADALYATDQLSTTVGSELVVTATNAGPDDAACVTVVLDPNLAEFLIDETIGGDGSFSDPVWDIGPLADGASVSLTIEGFVTTNVDRTASFTAEVAEDLSTANNTASIPVTLGFLFPPGTQVNAAAYVSKTVTVASVDYDYEQLMIGIYQGAPGIDGAVLCKVPEELTNGGSTIWPPAPLTTAAMPELWRPCARGLPFPLHPNGFFEDRGPDEMAGTGDETLWMPVWGSAGLYKSADKGQTWEEAWPRLGPGDVSQDAYWTNVYAITEDTAGFLYISANNGLVYRSLNSGGTWQQVGSLPDGPADTPWSLTAHPSESGILYAGTFGKGVYVSEDFGFTWGPLDDPNTGSADENEALLDTDLSGNFAGHVFDLKFSPDDDYLFAATGYGTWRANLTMGPTDFDGTDWEFIGPVVAVDATPAVTCTLVSTDPACVFPEVRSLAFAPNGGTAPDDDLVAGTWGFGAFIWDDPNDSSDFEELILKSSHIAFVSVSPTGILTVGGQDGTFESIAATFATSTAIEAGPQLAPEPQALPQGYALSQNYPNPFNPVTTIGFALPESGRVKLSVFDTLGREVAILVDGQVQAGQHEVQFSAGGLPTGSYLYRLQTDAGSIVRTLILMK